MLRNQGTRVGFFEIISTYFVKIYYNYLYEEALKKTQTSSNISINIIDEYRKSIVAFKDGLTKNHKYYYDTVKDIWATFQVVSPITLNEFVDTVVKLFIPDSYHDELINEKLRDRYMGNLILTMVSEFSTRINEIYADKITNDKYRGRALINSLQDDFNNILEIIRTNMNQKITNQAVKSTEVIPVEAFNKMKFLLTSAIEAKNKAESEVQELKNKLAATNEYKKKISSLENEILNLKSELAKYKKKAVSNYIENVPKQPIINEQPVRVDNIKNIDDNKSQLASFISENDDTEEDEPVNAKQAFAKKQATKKSDS